MTWTPSSQSQRKSGTDSFLDLVISTTIKSAAITMMRAARTATIAETVRIAPSVPTAMFECNSKTPDALDLIQNA